MFMELLKDAGWTPEATVSQEWQLAKKFKASATRIPGVVHTRSHRVNSLFIIMKELLAPTREKLIVIFYFLVVALLLFIIHSAFLRILLSGKNPQEGESTVNNVFPVINILFTFFQYYLFACVAVFLVKKSK